MLQRFATLVRFILWLYFSRTELTSSSRILDTTAAITRIIINEILCNIQDQKPTLQLIDPMRAHDDALFVEILYIIMLICNVNLLMFPCIIYLM